MLLLLQPCPADAADDVRTQHGIVAPHVVAVSKGCVEGASVAAGAETFHDLIYSARMNVAVQLEFKADRKEPLGDLIRRVAAQFEQNRVTPDVVATFSDGPGGIRPVSAVERAIKKYPHLARFELNDSPLPAAHIPPTRRLTSHDPANPIPMTDILALADGVPRS